MNHEKRRAIMKQTERQNLNKPQFIFGLIEVVVFIVCLYLLFLSTVTCPMNEVLTASTGVIMSQSPGSGFPHFESCSWVVKVEPGYNITFTIEHFQTSRQFDELEIFDGESAHIVHTEHMYTNGYLQYRVIICYFFSIFFYFFFFTWSGWCPLHVLFSSILTLCPYDPSPHTSLTKDFHKYLRLQPKMSQAAESSLHLLYKKSHKDSILMVKVPLHLFCTFSCD